MNVDLKIENIIALQMCNETLITSGPSAPHTPKQPNGKHGSFSWQEVSRKGVMILLALIGLALMFTSPWFVIFYYHKAQQHIELEYQERESR